MVRMQAASRLLQQFEDEGNAFLKSVVTTDETWVHYFNPESQQSSREWRHTSSPKPKRARRSRLAGKVMASVTERNIDRADEASLPRNLEQCCQSVLVV